MTERSCKHCTRPIEHLPQKYKYCTLICRQSHNDNIKCAKNKKHRKCSVCAKPYDYKERGKKWTCSDKCETIQANRAKEKACGFRISIRKKEPRKCLRCSKPIKAKKHQYCRDCFIINKALVAFREEFVR